jgi:serine/threonine-protein kinase
MPAPTLDEFWQSLVSTRLLEPGAAAALRAEHAALPPAAAGDGSVKSIAAWLVERGAITRWQAKRLAIGDRGPFLLGEYRLLERHDRDGDSLLFTARHEPSGRPVTLVLLNAKRCRDLEVWTAIMRRTQAATQTAEPMLSRTWSLEQQDGSRFIVCEPVAGVNLADEVERLGPLPPQQAGVIALQVARAVAEIHSLGEVHGGLALDVLRREPPPAGVGERHGRVRLLQFPLTYDPHLVPLRPLVADEAEIARLARRAAFVAPELLEQDAACDARSDVYGIGAILSSLLTGAGPCWTGDARSTLEQAAAHGPAPLPPSVPEAMAKLVGRLMARDVALRPATAAEAAEAIARCLGIADAAIAAARPAASAEPAAPAFDFAAASSPPSRSPAAGMAAAKKPSAAQRPSRGFPWVGAAMVAAIVAGAAGFVVVRLSGERPKRVAKAPKLPATTATAPAAAPAPPRPTAPAAVETPPPPPKASRQIIVEDPEVPWASPTVGPPPTLAYLPPGSQLVLLARLASVEADEEGRLFLKSLGPAAEAAVESLVKLCGGDAAAIELVQAGWQAGGPDEVVGGYAVRFADGHAAPPDEAARQAAWGPTKAETIAGETVHQSATLSFWVPPAEKGRVLVIVPRAAAKAPGGDPTPVVGAAVEPPIASIIREAGTLATDETAAIRAALPADLETLVAMLDAERHVTLLGSPHYLLNAGRVVLAGPLAKLAEPIDALFGGSLQAAALSLHFGESSYVELDAVATPDVPAKKLAPEIAGRVEGLADAVEGYCTALNPDPYGRMLVLRLPAMLRVLSAQIRSGAEGRGVVLNAYLPRHAPHNIALAAELALAQTPGAAVAAGPTAAPPAAEAKGALAKLGKKLTLTFAKDNLERSIQLVSEETGVPMEILGGDLQLEGITKNQSFGLEERDKTADEILRVILAKSNPDGKLVYIVKEKDGEEWVLITTRAAVEKRRDTLPPAYAPKK